MSGNSEKAMMNTTPLYDFSSLTPDRLWYALESIGIRAESGFLALGSYENRVYQFVCEARQRYVVKCYRPKRWCKEQLEEEHAYLLELKAAGLSVAAPLVIKGKSLHCFEGHYFTLYPSIGGRAIEAGDLNQLDAMGQLLGQMHHIGCQSSFRTRASLNPSELLEDARATLIQTCFIPKTLEESFLSTADNLIEQIKSHWFAAKMLRVQGDCHVGNWLWTDTGPCLLDFDDCLNGPAICDLWMLMSGDSNEMRIQLETLLESYQEHYEFNLKELELIEPLRGLRLLTYMAWLAKRWGDPAFVTAFPWFSEQEYWHHQIRLLEQQIEVIAAPSIKLFSY